MRTKGAKTFTKSLLPDTRLPYERVHIQALTSSQDAGDAQGKGDWELVMGRIRVCGIFPPLCLHLC